MNMNWMSIVLVLWCLASASARQPKILSIFSVVRFNNSPCFGTNNRNGTCYTADECASRGGAAAGSCAQSYGVCCTFSVGCGGTSNENCTYFESSGISSGACRVKICRCNDNICQLRLDFSNFVITGPSTQTVGTGMTIGGVLAPGATLVVTPATQCLTDSFSVTNPGGQSPPTICGSNSGEHMYVDASSSCNELAFQLGSSTIDASSVSRGWSIKVTQYACDYNNLAPKGCTQYFFGTTTDTVQTFNFDSGVHLANQNQNICVRQEAGNCRICWTAVNDDDFVLSGPTSLMSGFTKSGMCCGYGMDGQGVKGYDCVMIPGAEKMTDPRDILQANSFCGRSKGLVTMEGTVPATVCSSQQPFNIRFVSDAFEMEAETPIPGKGFRLTYIQTTC
ncbi:uncharacterized protein LOC131891786 [Tigriopus californicus]|uniref:uncharacterized protein LOC131891786 n=1 Tax=Tigriopus californicus TaxID=6832 RepID=UPI0027DA21F7|nr:uncharacterized protein LOC131891786 [Tigriopus californicus]